MKRRSFLTTAIPTVTAGEDDPGRTPSASQPSEFANKVLPKVARSIAGIEPYAGAWGFNQAAHLLRRTTFGVRRQDVAALLAAGMDGSVAQLLSAQPDPAPPLTTNINDTGALLGTTWVNAPTSDFNPVRRTSLRSWWTGLMIGQPVSLVEKMTLFWHNHFVTESVDVTDARMAYRYNALLRQNALGNFRTLARLVTTDCAMLRYLNGNTNTGANPNENYARELQELFTIGKGPEIAPGDYTNYTEEDVKAAARVLTGWRDNNTTFQGYFTASRHDATNKQFSPAYQSTLVTGLAGTAGAGEVDALLDMIFLQPETAKFICRKLYRWFVYYLIDDTAEANVIVPLANLLRANNYDIAPVLQALFKSAHFYDSVNTGCIIKNPIDLTVGTMRTFGVQFPDASAYAAQYNQWKYVEQQSEQMQLVLCDPPNVAGWPAYYQTPQFHELWINSDTLPKRKAFTDKMGTTGNRTNSTTIVIDPIAFAQAVTNPYDANVLIDEFALYLFPLPLTANQKAFLKETLIPGLPDYEWTIEWNDYVANPSDAAKKDAVKTKLQALLLLMMSMAEYQLM
jgi:uncharacterized protein (DUF1800 family)